MTNAGFDGPVEGALSFARRRAEDKKLRGGSVGDAFAAFRGAQFADIGKAGVWSDLSAQDLLSRYDARLISPGNADGKQLGLPYQLVFNMPVSNVDLLAGAGYAEPPEGWDGFLAMCDALKRKGLVPLAWPGGVYGAFFVLPALQGLRYGVTDWDGFSPTFNEVGVSDLVDVITADDLFRNALGNNVKFMLVVVLGQTALSLLLAVLLAARSRGSTLLRGLFFLPTILSSVSVAFVWRFVYDPTFGLANTVLGAVGVDSRPAYLGDAGTAILWVAISQIWFHAGQMMIVHIAGINQIPAELYDAARADGAGRRQQFRFVTWPMVAPATALVVAYTTIQSFKAFDLILGLAGNPPRAALDILSTRIYTTFANSQLGYAAAESIVFMAAIAVITWLQNRAARLAHG